MTTPATGPISITNLQAIYGVTSLGGMRTLHPAATSAGGGIVSMASMRGVGNAITGWFDAPSFTGNTWVDRTGLTNAPVTRGNVLTANLATSNGVTALAGTTLDGIRFASTLLPNANTYTLFHMARYAANARARIFDGTPANWLSGFYQAKAPVAFHGGAFITPQIDVHGNSWVQSTDRYTSYRSNKVDRTTGTAGTTGNFTLTINDGIATTETSQWQCAEVLAFNRLLANAEIYAVESYLADKYYLDMPRDPYLLMHAKDASATAGQVSVTSWGIAGGSDVSANVWSEFACGGNTVPTAFAAGGWNGGPFVRFERSKSHHFNAGTKTFNMLTNGGFTAVVALKFSGVIASWERVFDFFSGADSNNIQLARNGVTRQLYFIIKTDSDPNASVLSPTTIVQEEWAVYACTYSTTTGRMSLYKNGTLLSFTGVVARADRTLSSTYIGRPPPSSADAYFNGDISKFLVYDRALTDAEVVVASGSGTPPSGPLVFLDAAVMTNAKSSPIVSNVSFWNGFTAANVPQLVNPSVPAPAPHFFAIDRTQSQYMDAGPRTFNISTNGGFTVIMYTRFTGAVNAWERLVNFNSGPYTNEVGMLRSGTSTDLVFGLRDGGGTFFGAYANGTIVQNEWAVWVGRYTTATSSIQIYKNNANVGALGSVTLQSNKTVGNTWLGRITAGGDQPLSADISAFAAYDRSLTDAELTEAHNAMVYGTSTLPATPSLAITPQAYTNFASYRAPSYVSFVRPSTQFANGGTRTFSCGTNGGFTALAAMRFTGNATITNERIFDFQSSGSDIMQLYRVSTTANIGLNLYNSVTPTVGLGSTSSPIVQGEWAVYACRMTNATGIATIFKNNVSIGAASGVTSLTNRTLTSTLLANTVQSAGTSNIDVQSFVVYDRALTDAEMTQAHTFLTTGAGASPPNPVLNLSAAAPMTALAVAAWGPMTAFGSPILTSGYSPLFGGFAPLGNPLLAVPRSGYLAKPCVDLVRDNAHSLNGGPRTLSIHTNGGFTALAHVRFNGAPTTGERIFDFGNAASNNNIVLGRGGAADPSVTFAIYAPTAFAVTVAGNANVIVQNQWAVLGCRYAASNNFMQIFKDNVSIASGAGPASSAIGNRTVANTFVGASHFGDLTANISVRAFVAYDRALTDAEMTTAYGCMVYGTGTLPSSPAVQLEATNLLGSTVTSWGSFAAFNAPTVYPSGGPLQSAYVTLDRASTQYLNAGTQSFTMTQGFTAIAHVRFTGTVGSWERIFDFSNGPDSSNVFLARVGTSGQLLFRILVGVGLTEYGVASSASTIVQGEWAVYACRYDPTARTMTLYKDGTLISTVTGVPLLTDRTLSLTYVGQSAYGGNAYLGGDIRFLGVYNRALSDSELTSAHTFLANGTGSLPGAPMLLATSASLTTQSTQTPTFTSSGNPQAFHTGGFQGGPYVQLTRSIPHFFNAGSRFLNSTTNLGFTGIAMIKFKGSVGIRERIFDIPGASRSLGFCRNSTNPQLQFFATSVANASNTYSAYSTNCVVADEWAAFACRYVAAQQSMQIFKNNANVGVQGSVPMTAFPDQTTPAINVGRSNWPGSDAYTNADLKCLLIYDRALTDAELTQAFQYCVSDAPAPPITPLCALHAKDLVLETNKGALPAWPAFGTALANGAGFQSGTTPGLMVRSKGGYGDQGFITFDRARSQYLFSPTPVTFRLTTNGGFTAITHMRYTTGTSNFERIFDFHDNGVFQNAGIKLYRLNADPTALTFMTGNSTSQTSLSSPTSTVVANQWAVFACRYIAATTTAQIFKNNILIATSSAAAVLPDMTLSNVWVGRSWEGSDSYLAGDMRFFGMYDRALTDAEMTSAHAYVLKSDFAPSATIKSFGNLKLWLDAEHFGRFASGGNTWTDMSTSGYDFTVGNTAVVNSGNTWHMNFTGTAGHATRLVAGLLTDVPFANTYTFVTFTSLLNSTATFRTLTRSALHQNHPVLIQSGSNLVGQWWNGFYSSGYNINNLANHTTKLNFMAFKFASGTWEMLAAPSGTVTSVANIANATINSAVQGFASIGGVQNTQYWGNIGSFMYFDRHLSTPELQSIYADQWARYGLVAP